MIKQIKVLNRQVMEMYANLKGVTFPHDYWYLISVYSSDDGPYIRPKTAPVLNDLGCGVRVSLCFHDVTKKKYDEMKKQYPDNKIVKDIVLFDKDHAKKVLLLLDCAQRDNEDITLVVHCAAGISRSGAIATFACDYCGLDYNEFLKDNPLLYPNDFVLETLYKVSGRKQIKGHDGINHKYDGMLTFT